MAQSSPRRLPNDTANDALINSNQITEKNCQVNSIRYHYDHRIMINQNLLRLPPMTHLVSVAFFLSQDINDTFGFLSLCLISNRDDFITIFITIEIENILLLLSF